MKLCQKNKRSNITYEYILLNEFNDTKQDALDLVKFVRNMPAKINIIEYNKVEGTTFEKASNNRLHNFINILFVSNCKKEPWRRYRCSLRTIGQ